MTDQDSQTTQRIERKRSISSRLMSAFHPPQHLILIPPLSNSKYSSDHSHLPLKKRPFQGPMNDISDNDNDSLPPTKLRRLVASYWTMSRWNDAASSWRQITLGPPASGSYLYSEQYPEDDPPSWQQRVLECNTAVTKRTKYRADGMFIPMPFSDIDLDRKPSPLRRTSLEEDTIPMAPTTTPLGPSRRTTAAFERHRRPGDPTTVLPLTSLRRIPGADSLSYSTDTVETPASSEGLRRPPFHKALNLLSTNAAADPERDEEDDDDDELLILERPAMHPPMTQPFMPSLASVTPSPHFFLHPPAPRLVRPTPRPSSAAAMRVTQPHRAPGPHVFRPVAPPPVAPRLPRRRTAAHPWTPVTAAFVPGRRPQTDA